MSVSGARSIPLLLLLAAGCSSDAAGTPAPITTTETTSQQTPVSTSGSTGSGYATYSTGPSNPTEDAKEPTTKSPILETVKYNITLKELSTVVKNITLVQPAVLELLCTLEINLSPDKATIEVTWQKDNTTIRDDKATKDEHQNIWSTLYMAEIKNRTQLGDYSCVFQTKQKEKPEGKFSVQVPEIGGKSKSLIGYEGDSVVMSCNSGKYVPLDWVWYTMNGSEQAVINDTLRPEKYEVFPKNRNVTKLKVLDLTVKDGGFYWCEARFLELGESRGKASLKVLTYMEPLKPFLAIAAEVIILVALIFIFEIYTKKKEPVDEGEKEFEQTEQLKSDDSNGVENSTTRLRKV